MHHLCHGARGRMTARPVGGEQQGGDTWNESLQTLLVHDETETVALNECFLRREVTARGIAQNSGWPPRLYAACFTHARSERKRGRSRRALKPKIRSDTDGGRRRIKRPRWRSVCASACAERRRPGNSVAVARREFVATMWESAHWCIRVYG